jgi:hypothetical protein
MKAYRDTRMVVYSDQRTLLHADTGLPGSRLSGSPFVEPFYANTLARTSPE